MATSRKNKSKPAVEDIDHVDVPAANATPTVQQPQEAVVVEAEEDPAKTLELTIQREIKRFGIADAGIAELKTKYGELTIADMNDKAGYEAVKKAWNEVRGVRTALEKKGLDIRGSYTKITKAVKAEEDRLVALVVPLEEDLQGKYRHIDNLKEAEKQRKAAEAEKKLQDRVDELIAAGCKFEHGYYGIGGTIAVDVATLREMPEDQFGTLKVAVEAKAQELAEEAERQRLKKEEEDAQRAKEDQRLKDEAAKLQKEKDDLERERRELQEQREEAAKLKRELRLDRLQAAGLTLAVPGDHVLYDNGHGAHRLELADIMAADEETFKGMVATAKERVADAKEKLRRHEEEVVKERKALEDKKTLVNEKMVAAGLTYNYGTDDFTFKNPQVAVRKRMDELVPLTSEELDRLADQMKDLVAAAKEQQAEVDRKEKADRERERLAGLSDAELMVDYLTKLGEVPLPELKTTTMQTQLAQFCGKFATLMDQYRPAKEAVPA